MRRDQREQEFTEFFSVHGPGLRRTAYLVVRDWHLAEDLTQQGMAKLYAVWSRTRPATRTAYARKVVVNECLSHLRRRRPESPTDQLPDRPGEEPTTGLDLGAALAVLPARQRAIVALRFLDDLPVAEVAELLGVAEGTVKSQTARALGTLRTHLPELIATEETR
ncbi:SigE family RNA polymerase sigma factor [Nocardioides sp. MAHUQ-72]|uniref:SigE family RNA polymerase sigma factor n=1 Tax=unclassified Nocardioides TaxID=2615069 RepID=UPI00361C2A35